MSKNSLTKYYKIKQRKASKGSPERYQDLSEEKNNKRWQYSRERCKILFEHEKERLVKYRRKQSKVRKNKATSQTKND